MKAIKINRTIPAILDTIDPSKNGGYRFTLKVMPSDMTTELMLARQVVITIDQTHFVCNVGYTAAINQSYWSLSLISTTTYIDNEGFEWIPNGEGHLVSTGREITT